MTCTTITVERVVSDVEQAWQPFLAGQGPAPGHLARLHRATREQVRQALVARLPVRGDGTVALSARAFAVGGYT